MLKSVLLFLSLIFSLHFTLHAQIASVKQGEIEQKDCRKDDTITKAPDAFVPVEKESGLDLEELQKNIVYPVEARKQNIEGKVIVKVLVDKTGKVKKTLVDFSDNEMLNDAAVKAVKNAKFTPAIQKGEPITSWVSIPITFKLRD